MTIFGIDISEHQDGLSLTRAKAEGINFVIIRTTDGTYKDQCFSSHVHDALANHLPVMAYHYLRAPKEGTSVAEQVHAAMDVLGDYRFPLWIDVETEAGLHVDDIRTCQRLFQARGVPIAGVYSYVPYWENRVAPTEPDSHEFGKLWVAAYGQNAPGVPASIYPGDQARQWDYPLGNQKPVVWQFTSRGQVAGFEVDVNAFRGDVNELVSIFHLDSKEETVEKVLPYPRDQVIQDTVYYCGPATVQTIIRAASGDLVPESTLAGEMGTTVNGTDHIGLLANALNRRLGQGEWRTQTIPNDPPSASQVEQFWQRLQGAIDGGYGVAGNIVAPPANYPQPSYKSTEKFRYSGGTVYHYVAFMGYAVDGSGRRHVWWADSGFSPYGGWVTLEQTVSLLAIKGYAYPTQSNPTIKKEDQPVMDMAAKDNQIQLRGPEQGGWDLAWLVEQPAKRGNKYTMVEMVATLVLEMQKLREEVKELKAQ